MGSQMDLIDISVPLSDATPAWPDSPGYSSDRLRSLERGDACNVTVVRMDVHAGTHVDAPAHFLGGGATVDSLPLDSLVGLAFVADLG